MKFYGRVLSSTRKNWLNFGGDLGIVRWVNEQKNSVIVVAYPDRRAGNDPEPFFFFFFFFLGGRVGSLSQPRLNIFTVGNMRVMICLGQGGLRSLSASSLEYTMIYFHNFVLLLDISWVGTFLSTNFLFMRLAFSPGQEHNNQHFRKYPLTQIYRDLFCRYE